jgi:hypothetical protein
MYSAMACLLENSKSQVFMRTPGHRIKAEHLVPGGSADSCICYLPIEVKKDGYDLSIYYRTASYKSGYRDIVRAEAAVSYVGALTRSWLVGLSA